MKINKIVLLACVSIAIVLTSCSKSDVKSGASSTAANASTTSRKATSSLTAAKGTATIEYRYNVSKEDVANNYFYWSADGGEMHLDGFDTASGASTGRSTSLFNEVRFDESGKKKAIPLGLRYLLLYAIASRTVFDDDAFTVAQNGNNIVITFIHFGNAFRITSNNGVIDTSSSFETAAGLADRVDGKMVLKPEYTKAGADATKMSSADWSKIKLAADVADADASYKYTGKLSASYKDGVLEIKGTLNKE